MSLTRMILKLAAPVPQVEAFERYLFVGPHPDDIEIGAGATAAKLAAQGKTVCFLICTDGRFGDGNTVLKGGELAQARMQEARQSAALLGVHDVRFLGLSDGGGYTQEALATGIAHVIGDFQPDVVFAPDPCVPSECHTDHLNTGEAVRRLACFAPYDGIMAQHGAKGAPVRAAAFYMTARPNRYVKTSGYLSRQLSAVFDCHKTQFPQPDGQIALYLKLRAFDFGLRSFKGCAEGFRVLGVLHMHCMPEIQ